MEIIIRRIDEREDVFGGWNGVGIVVRRKV